MAQPVNQGREALPGLRKKEIPRQRAARISNAGAGSRPLQRRQVQVASRSYMTMTSQNSRERPNSWHLQLFEPDQDKLITSAQPLTETAPVC